MKKRKYLYRLALSLFLILLLPMGIFIIVFSKYSYEKVEDANRVYSDALMDYHAAQVDQLIIELRQQAASIAADSKSATSVFWETGTKDNYWYYQAIAELREKYGALSADQFGIYYYDEGRIITSSGVLSIADYLKKYEIADIEAELYLKDYFDKKAYEEFKLCVGGTEYQEPGKNIMMIGFFNTLGRQRDKVMIFFKFSEQDMFSYFESVYVDSGFEYALWNKNSGFSFFFDSSSNTDYKDMVREMVNQSDTMYQNEGLLVKESQVHPLVLIGYMNENAPRNIALSFMDNMLLIVSLMLCIALIGSSVILYIAYKPVFHLTRKLKHIGGNEFETIAKALDDRSEKIEEQEMLLLDLLINNLLYKASISKEKLSKLGVELAEYYTVFLLEDHVLTGAETKHVILEGESRYRCRMFITDLDGEPKSVFVVFLYDDQAEEIKEWLLQRCRELVSEEIVLLGGKVVQDIKEIWSCLQFCNEELKQTIADDTPEAVISKSSTSREAKREQLRKNILAYVEEHYCDVELTQVLIADHFNISTYTLSRIFKNDVGIGFVSYVNARRIEYAKELLLTTNASVQEIAIKTGFDNDNYFAKVFKANTGMSPTTFRNS